MGLWSNFAMRRTQNGGMSLQNGGWDSLFNHRGAGNSTPLGTARWMAPEAAIDKFRYPGSPFDGRIWIGEGFDQESSPLGYKDDRHVCLVSGTRGGKGVGVLVPNLCFWPGSCIVVDPKGENASVTARRWGGGSNYTEGMGQKVCILDPFGEVQLPNELKARYNPLDAIDPESDLAIDDAARISAALVVVQSKTDPYWEEAARNLIKGLILHVLSEPDFDGCRNLVTVRRLLTQGDWITVEKVRNASERADEGMPSAFEVLWGAMRRNPAFNSVVAGVGEQMIAMADKQRSGVLEAARTHTEFLDSIPMQRLLEKSDFDLGEIKTNPEGITVYLTLPQRFMETHYRWLRLMIVLAVGEMERIKGRPATDFPTLFLLDEFAGLKRMEIIENAAAQAAGFGIKFLFVVQNLAQLQELYEKSWETFLGNSGLKMFFQIDDDFTRSYVSRLIGEREVTRETRSGSRSRSTSRSTTDGQSFSTNFGTSSGSSRGQSTGVSRTYSGLSRFFFSKSRSDSSGENWSRSSTTSSGRSRGTSFSRSESLGDSTTSGWGEAVHKRPLLNPDEIGRFFARIDDRDHPAYPGMVLAVVPGQDSVLARRVNYFEAPAFAGCFDPHPNFPPPPTLAELDRAAALPRAAAIPDRPRRLARLGAEMGFILVVFAVGIPGMYVVDHYVIPHFTSFLGLPQNRGLVQNLKDWLLLPPHQDLVQTTSGNLPWVLSLAFSPDGRTIAAGGNGNDGKSVRLWDVARGQLTRTLTEPQGSYSVAFSPDGHTIASGSLGNSIEIWDVASGKLLRSLTGHSGTVRSVAFSPDGRILASGSEDKTVILWDAASGQKTRVLQTPGWVISVVFSPDGRTLASGGGSVPPSVGPDLWLWDVATGQMLRTLTGDRIISVAFSPDGRILAASGANAVWLWDATSGKLLHTMSEDSAVGPVAFSPDGRTLATGTAKMGCDVGVA
jgi:type IV secretory pathway TraG/TraD family ATPase VirD4